MQTKSLEFTSRTVKHLALATSILTVLGGTALAQGAKVGALIPLTGGLQTYGESSLNGLQLAIDEANAAGGVLDGDIEVVVGDTQTKAQPAIDAANKLVTVDGVAAVFGALASGNTIPVATTVTSVEGVPQISNASTAPSITTLDDNDFLFRTAPSDSEQGVVLGELVKAQGLNNVAVVYVNNDYGQGLAEAFEASFTEAGGTVTGSSAYEPNKPSYRGELSGLANGDAEALLLIAYPDDGGLLIVRQSLEEGFFDRFVFTDGMKTEQLLSDIGAEYVDGAFGTSSKAVESDAATTFANIYNEAHGELPPLPYIDTAYDAGMILALAIEKAGSTDGAAIRDAIRDVANPPGEAVYPGEFEKAKQLIADGQDINYEGAAGAMDLDQNGDISGTFEHWAVQDGALVTVELLN